MSYCFNIGICLLLVILQTTVMPDLSLLDRFYDLLIPFIVYLGLSRPLREGLLFVCFLGFIMDNLSGSPFGLYLTSYFWLFSCVKLITQLLQVGKRLFVITFIVAAGVLMENLFFLGSFAIFTPEQEFAGDAFTIIAGQVLWALLTGAALLMLFRNTHNWLDTGFRAVWARNAND
jgi:cell shape-determining protein MreD